MWAQRGLALGFGTRGLSQEAHQVDKTFLEKDAQEITYARKIRDSRF